MFIKNQALGINEILCENLQEKKSEFKVIDVRRDDEFTGELGHIEGAELKTLGPDLLDYLDNEERDVQIVFVCRSGGRSGQATQMAQQMGFINVSNMIGGMIEWNRLNLPKQ